MEQKKVNLVKKSFTREHVRLVCDIYCAHEYLCRCDSTLFCFRKLTSRQLIFLINCRSNLRINIVRRVKSMRNDWLTMSTLTKENVFFFWFQAFTWLVLCCWRSWRWRTWLKTRELERKYLKIWPWESYRLLWNMSRYVILSIGSDLLLVTVFLRKIQTPKISWKTWYLHTFFNIQINLVSKQLKWVRIFKLTKFS